MSDQTSRRIQLSLERAYELHQRAMDASSCGITIADGSQPDIPLIYANQSFCSITGYSLDETLGRNCRFLQRDDRAQQGLQTLREAVRAGRRCTVTLRNYRRDQSMFWNELLMSPVIAADGRVTHFVGIQTDVTARRNAEEALSRESAVLEHTVRELRETQMMLVHAEKMNALGQMVAGIAHEINNPLSFVNSNLYSLRDSIQAVFAAYTALETLIVRPGSTASPEDVRQVREQADLDYVLSDVDDLIRASLDGLHRVKGIVHALRTFARLDEAEFKFASIEECVSSALMIAAGEIGSRIQVHLDLGRLPLFYCSPAEINQVFLNLIVNAAQSIRGVGEIRIRGRDLADAIEVVIEDTGAGMPPEVIQQIFTPFFTTKPSGEGVGLGLAIAWRIVTERHHGTIHVQSQPGSGTTFTVVLPKEKAS